MCPSQLAKQTLNKNNNTTTHHRDNHHPSEQWHHHQYCKDTHYKNKHPHKNNPQHDSNHQTARVTVRAMLASTIQKSRQQETTSSPVTRPTSIRAGA